MLSSEFTQELGALIRSLETRIRMKPQVVHSDEGDVLEHLQDAIIALIAVYLSLRDEID